MELRFAGDTVPADAFEAPAGRVATSQLDDHTLRMRVSGPITPVVQAAARYELLDFVSREPSLEETFLAQYGRDGRGGGAGMTATAAPALAAGRDHHSGRFRRIYGFGCVYAQDAPRLAARA